MRARQNTYVDIPLLESWRVVTVDFEEAGHAANIQQITSICMEQY